MGQGWNPEDGLGPTHWHSSQLMDKNKKTGQPVKIKFKKTVNNNNNLTCRGKCTHSERIHLTLNDSVMLQISIT
jgi:hypothetical protein